MIEKELNVVLSNLVDGRVYPDITPDTYTLPLIIYQQVGGKAYSYLEQKLPDHKNARMQIYVWAKSRLEANSIARKVEQQIIENMKISSPIGAFTSIYKEEFNLYGTRQDFSIWYEY